MKVLVNDEVWMIGANAIVQIPHSSSSVDLYPFFFTNNGK
jgi:hypothetical protein